MKYDINKIRKEFMQEKGKELSDIVHDLKLINPCIDIQECLKNGTAKLRHSVYHNTTVKEPEIARIIKPIVEKIIHVPVRVACYETSHGIDIEIGDYTFPDLMANLNFFSTVACNEMIDTLQSVYDEVKRNKKNIAEEV